MSGREYAKQQIDVLPESAIKSILEFISFQKYSLGLEDDDPYNSDLYDNDTDYLCSIPGMKESILEGGATPLSECLSSSEVWGDVGL